MKAVTHEVQEVDRHGEVVTTYTLVNDPTNPCAQQWAERYFFEPTGDPETGFRHEFAVAALLSRVDHYGEAVQDQIRFPLKYRGDARVLIAAFMIDEQFAKTEWRSA